MAVTFSKLGKYGRLGNQMFQVASTIGIATRNKMEYGFPEWNNWDAVDRFGSEEDVEVGKWFKELPEAPTGAYHSLPLPWGYNVVKLEKGKNYDIEGHMQSEKYFNHCKELIKDLFTLEGEPTNKIAVHIRMGDYCHSNDYHPVCSYTYYQQAMDMIGRDNEFLIFSDEPDKAEEMFPNMEIDRSDTKEALRRMMWCRHFIIANSTFSWWGSWLGWDKDKRIIAPRRWFGDLAGISSKDIYTQNMIVI
jgi:hypothetical protein